MKKILSVLLVLTMCFSFLLMGCQKDEYEAENEEKKTELSMIDAEEETQEKTEEPTAEEEEQEVSVYLLKEEKEPQLTILWSYADMDMSDGEIACVQYLFRSNEKVVLKQKTIYEDKAVEESFLGDVVTTTQTTEYDKNGKVIRHTMQSDPNYMSSDAITTITEYTYNDAGIPTGKQINRVNLDGTKMPTEIVTYECSQVEDGWVVQYDTETGCTKEYYNEVGQLVTLESYFFGDLETSLTYEYNAAGALTLMLDQLTGRVTTYVYDTVVVQKTEAERFVMLHYE